MRKKFSTRENPELKKRQPWDSNPRHAAQKEGCAERIAPIGTLSQNGYGESMGTHKRTMGKPDV